MSFHLALYINTGKRPISVIKGMTVKLRGKVSSSQQRLLYISFCKNIFYSNFHIE